MTLIFFAKDSELLQLLYLKKDSKAIKSESSNNQEHWVLVMGNFGLHSRKRKTRQHPVIKTVLLV